jgi:hypothetical protein
MFTLKRLYDVVMPSDYWAVDDTVPVHMFTAMENDQGSVFCNLEAKLVVLNLTGSAATEPALELAGIALAEMSALDTGTLVYDVRHNPDTEGSAADVAVRVHLLESSAITCLAVLAARGSVSVEANSVRRLRLKTKVEVLRAHEFGHLTSILNTSNPVLALACAAVKSVADFAANYGGSVFSIPELQATVIRMSGNSVNPEYFQEVFYSGLALHLRNKASTLILDSSDSPATTDAEAYLHVRKMIATSLAALGIASTVVLVHLNDAAHGGQERSFEEVCADWDVFGCETETLAEAFALVRILKGCCTQVVPTFPGVALARV